MEHRVIKYANFWYLVPIYLTTMVSEPDRLEGISTRNIPVL